MKFTAVWAETAAKNVTLKVVIALLSLLTGSLGITTAKLSLRDPLIIERTCFPKALTPASTARTVDEIEAFIKAVIHQRFDSGAAVIPGYLSVDEEVFRRQEQDALKTSNMTQVVIVNSIKIDKESVTVDADRLISVGQVRSAFAFPLVATLSSTPRTEGNPYGLVVIKVSPVNKEEVANQ